jgi:hypothetical protein
MALEFQVSVILTLKYPQCKKTLIYMYRNIIGAMNSIPFHSIACTTYTQYLFKWYMYM